MADKLAVDKEVLGAQVKKLYELANSSELENAVAGLDGLLALSTGETAAAAAELQTLFAGLRSKLTDLYQRTAEFMDNKHGDFVEADGI